MTAEMIKVAIVKMICILKDISKMKFFSLFGIIDLFYTIIVLVIQSYFYWDHYLDNVF